MLLETSKDLLYIVLAFCFLWLTIFTSWVIYYIAQILKQGRDVIRDVRSSLGLFEKLITSIQGKIDSSSTHLAFLAEGVKQGLKFMNERKNKKAKSKRTKNQ
jgi:hypothetical protein